MTDSEETFKQTDSILQAIADLGKQLGERIDRIEKRLNSADAQLEAIREGITYNSTRLDRIEGNFLLLRADVREMSEEFRKDKLALK